MLGGEFAAAKTLRASAAQKARSAETSRMVGVNGKWRPMQRTGDRGGIMSAHLLGVHADESAPGAQQRDRKTPDDSPAVGFSATTLAVT